MQTAVYYSRRQGKEGALSIYHLNYLLSESLEGFELVRASCPGPHVLHDEKCPAPVFPLPEASMTDGLGPSVSLLSMLIA